MQLPPCCQNQTPSLQRFLLCTKRHSASIVHILELQPRSHSQSGPRWHCLIAHTTISPLFAAASPRSESPPLTLTFLPSLCLPLASRSHSFLLPSLSFSSSLSSRSVPCQLQRLVSSATDAWTWRLRSWHHMLPPRTPVIRPALVPLGADTGRRRSTL